MRLFLNSDPLSDKMYCGHTYNGRYSFIKVETIVSAVLSGMGYASGYPVRWSIIVKICLLPDVDVSHSVMRLIAILSNGLSWDFHHLKRVILKSWPSLCDKVCSLQYISRYPCSYPSSNIVFLSNSMYRYYPDVLTCCGLPPGLCISRMWG